MAAAWEHVLWTLKGTMFFLADCTAAYVEANIRVRTDLFYKSAT